MSNKDKSLFLYLVRPLRHLLLATILCGAFVQAENIYVTDMLRLDMYPTEEMTGPSMRNFGRDMGRSAQRKRSSTPRWASAV